ncbi:ORF100 [Saltwater crocodilepox virus]|nr:RNA polymerase subunit RPO7 [Saltwater crocodilepox virus]AVD69435.1 RNA polymerase subunit RPO7 [Saltwater crocodilepox virus]QGT46539.1 ORF100 [Saltwater crocodilepox virus]QGT46755.1 ORF100 [Saltwater crocodilepox virus]QGT46971.1 ORF100 [Saltwater crocodilepox virus]
MVYPMVCSTCGFDLTEARYRLVVQKATLSDVLATFSRPCCRIKLSTQIEPPRNLTILPMLDVN